MWIESEWNHTLPESNDVNKCVNGVVDAIKVAIVSNRYLILPNTDVRRRGSTWRMKVNPRGGKLQSRRQ